MSEALALSVVVPDLWQTYPKAFAVGRAGLEVDLLAGAHEPVRLGLGAATTHDVWIRLDRPRGASTLAALAARVARPTRAVAPAAWTRETEALAGILDPADAAAQRFLARLRSDALRYDARARYERWDDGPPGPCVEREAAMPRVGFYGALNWGDWNFPGYRDGAKGCDAWGNLEYDLPLVFGLAFASTADPLWAEWFERALVHYRDVDVIHAAPAHPEWVGLNHPHKVGHFDWRAKGNVDLGHAWLGGLLLHHRLTGDARSGAAALRMADRLAERATKASNPRHFGWPMIALGAMADATHAERHRAAAIRYATLAMDRFAPDPGAADWKLGILASGLAAVHRATGDAAIRAWLLRYGEHLLADEHATELDPRYVAVSGYLATLSGDARYRELARAVAADMPLGTWGKTLAMHGRIGFDLLGLQPTPEASAPEATP